VGLNNYGAHHRRLRAALLPYAPGSPCTRCGRPIALGDRIDLDHTDDGTAYAGWAHASCNRRAGAIKGNRARRTPDRRTMNEQPCALGIDIANDREHTSAVFATRVDDAVALVELTYIDGSDVAHVIAGLAATRPGLIATVVDPQSPATTLLEPLRKIHRITVTEPSARDVALAHALFLDELKAGRLRYVEHDALTTAAQHAMARPLAGAEALERRRVDVDASPMTAAQLAVWGLLRRAGNPVFAA
jgi:hypothetical protein